MTKFDVSPEAFVMVVWTVLRRMGIISGTTETFSETEGSPKLYQLGCPKLCVRVVLFSVCAK